MPIIDGILHSLEPLVRETNATVTRKVLPEVQADPVRLLQVFQNLIVNAINYSGDAPPRIRDLRRIFRQRAPVRRLR